MLLPVIYFLSPSQKGHTSFSFAYASSAIPSFRCESRVIRGGIDDKLSRILTYVYPGRDKISVRRERRIEMCGGSRSSK